MNFTFEGCAIAQGARQGDEGVLHVPRANKQLLYTNFVDVENHVQFASKIHSKSLAKYWLVVSTKLFGLLQESVLPRLIPFVYVYLLEF